MTHNSSFQPPQSSQSQSLLSSSSAQKCVHCNSDDHWILHNVGFRLECRKLCTSCVLKHHPTSFCPTCFNLHDPNSLNPAPYSSSSASSSSSGSSSNRTLTCLKCNSVSHIACVPPNTPKSPYLCPPCSNPAFRFFDFKKPRKNPDHKSQFDGGGGSSGGGGGGSKSKKMVEEQGQNLDEKSARVLLLAAKIAAISMSKVASATRADAERKVKDAALARKRAKEAIDHVMSLSNKIGNGNGNGKQQRIGGGSGSGSSYGGIKIERNGVAHNVGGSGGGNGVSNGNGTVVATPGVQINGGNNNNNERGKSHVVEGK